MGTHKSIKILLNHQDTQCIMIAYEGSIGKTLLAYDLFSTLDGTPGGVFTEYIVACKKYIISDVMIYTKNNVGSICNHGL